MADDVRPVVVAYDGSAAAREALEVSAQLFSNHPLVVVSVWEPGLALELSGSGVDWAATAPPDLDESLALDRAARPCRRRRRAGREAGAVLGRDRRGRPRGRRGR